MPFDNKYNYSKNKTCIDCGKHIANWATRCKSCAITIQRAKRHKPLFKECKNCGKAFRLKPSRADETHFCSLKCRTAYGRIPCPVCGKIFRPDHGNRTQIQLPTCSPSCRGILRRVEKIKLVCQFCSRAFERYPSQVTNERVFCSPECTKDFLRGDNPLSYTSVDCTCHICGKSFRRNRYKVDHFGGKYCSRECNSLSQVIPGTSEYRGPNWNEQRRKARKRDGYICQGCGIHQKEYGRCLDVHHVIPFRDFGVERYLEANCLENLVSLCKPCHVRTERGGIPLHELKLQLPYQR